MNAAQTTSYEDVYKVLIKEENDFEIEIGRNDYTSRPEELGRQQIKFTIPKPKCGEVLVASSGNFTFVCGLCLDEFAELQCFGEHIQSQHMTVKSESEDVQSMHEEDGQDPLGTAVISGRNTAPEYDDNFNSPSHSVNEESDEDYKPPEAEERKSPILDITDSASDTPKEQKYICDICGRSYVHKRSYQVHRIKVHETASIQKPLKILTDLPVLNTPIDDLTCKYCDKKCEDSESLRLHLTTHTGRRRFVCNYCNKTFSCRTTRLQHFSIHTGERHYKCPHCPKMFSGRSNLNSHVRAHLKIKNYSCDYCDKRFVQSSEKRVHELTHTGEKPHQCEECGQRYATSNKLTNHMRRHKNIRNYKCEICNKAFYGTSALKNHMPTHTGEKPFSCNICGQRFPRKKSLKTHKQLHTGEKNYVCNKCGKAFAQFAGLYSHMKSHGEKSK